MSSLTGAEAPLIGPGGCHNVMICVGPGHATNNSRELGEFLVTELRGYKYNFFRTFR